MKIFIDTTYGFNDYGLFKGVLNDFVNVTELSYVYADLKKFVQKYIEDRNIKMKQSDNAIELIHECDVYVAFWDGESECINDLIDYAKGNHKFIKVIIVETENE
jgi:translation initiation factor 2B subunit (eIF-2B alpha/beta/delta family)